MNKLFRLSAILSQVGTGAIAAGVMLASALPAVAFDIKGWQYSTDSFNDSSGYVPSLRRGGVGSGTNYEIYKTAVRNIDGKTIFAIRSNLPLGGARSSDANDGHIHWGDLIINTACEALDKVLGKSLFGIRFASGNDSGVSQTGVYANVDLFDLAVANGNPGRNLAEHNQWVINKGGSPQTGSLPSSYFDETTHVPTLIRSGTRIGDVEIISDTSSLDLDGFEGLGGTTVAFAWDSNLIPAEPGQEFCYSIGPECNNDIQGGSYIAEVPTPAAVLPVLSGLLAAAKRKRRDDEAEMSAELG